MLVTEIDNKKKNDSSAMPIRIERENGKMRPETLERGSRGLGGTPGTTPRYVPGTSRGRKRRTWAAKQPAKAR